MRARTAAALTRCVRVCVCERVRVRLGSTRPRRHMRAHAVGVDRVRFGSQAFYGAKTFNANIGAWNTASVTTLSSVCAAFGPAARHGGGMRSVCVRCGAAVVRGGTTDARALVQAHTYMNVVVSCY
jgi:hypothetical protein